MQPRSLTLQTSLDPDELRERLKQWEPWSVNIDFSNGISTKDFKHRVPFSNYPLAKFSIVETAIPFEKLSGRNMLDIGCNAGYNSLNATTKYGLRCVGIDVVPRHIEVSSFLSETAGIEAQFLLDSAECFRRREEFDVALHFGTLYHLPNPLLSLQLTFDNLRPGGYLALETQVYDHPDDPGICYFMHMQNDDRTNFWALSINVLTTCLRVLGFCEIQQCLKVVPAAGLPRYMSRIVVVARKPE